MRKVRVSSGRMLVSIEGEGLVCGRGAHVRKYYSPINTYEGHVPAPPQSTRPTKHFISVRNTVIESRSATDNERGTKGGE